MGRSLGVGVSREAVVDAPGQRVQLLQWYWELQPHFGGDQAPAGHAGRMEKPEETITQAHNPHVHNIRGSF